MLLTVLATIPLLHLIKINIFNISHKPALLGMMLSTVLAIMPHYTRKHYMYTIVYMFNDVIICSELPDFKIIESSANYIP